MRSSSVSFSLICLWFVLGLQAGDRVLGQALLTANSADESAVSLDGVWRFSPAGGVERDLAIPSFWEQEPGLHDVHQGVFRRNFDIPESFQGRRILLHFDAVGDAANVAINGQHAGGHIGPDLPFEIDVTGLVSAPSTSNRLEVAVRDDSFFSVPRQERDGRNRKTWLPRGMGANNRKGIYQSVTLLARPNVWLADVRIQTSVRRHEISVRYEIFNSQRQTIRARLGAQVLPASGSATALALPEKEVELPGYVTTTVTVSGHLGSEVQLWEPDHPALYRLRATLSDLSGPIARSETSFGFREVWFDGIHFYLNRIRCNLRGESPAYSEKQAMFATVEAATEMVRRY